MEQFDHILLFKTDIKNESGKDLLQRLLGADKRISRWNIDMEDEDCVLRVISHTLNHQHIIQLIKRHGYYCCELT